MWTTKKEREREKKKQTEPKLKWENGMNHKDKRMGITDTLLIWVEPVYSILSIFKFNWALYFSP